MSTRSFAMRMALSALLVPGLCPGTSAQGADAAVTWTTTAVAVESAGTQRLYRLDFSGRIAPGYIVYGSDFKAELGPNPTRLRIEGDTVTPREGLQSIGASPARDETFKADYTYFAGQATLTQLVQVQPGVRSVSGTLRGQTCYKADGTCRLFSARFEVPLP